MEWAADGPNAIGVGPAQDYILLLDMFAYVYWLIYSSQREEERSQRHTRTDTHELLQTSTQTRSSTLGGRSGMTYQRLIALKPAQQYGPSHWPAGPSTRIAPFTIMQAHMLAEGIGRRTDAQTHNTYDTQPRTALASLSSRADIPPRVL